MTTGGLYYWNDGRDVPDLMMGIYDYPKTATHPEFNLSLRLNFLAGGGDGSGFRFVGSEGVLDLAVGGALVLRRKPKVTDPGTTAGTFSKATAAEILRQHAQKYPAQRPSADGTRPGIFYLNTYDLPSRKTWAAESLFLREAIPGHHFQIGIQQELQGVPAFRRFGTVTAYVEGWGLYAESLGTELGVYTDPYQYFGRLQAELFRAVRLVVDTGLHSKGWSRQQVIDYMQANSAQGLTPEISETERYMAIPGQALAYKIGELKIRELRTRAEKALGPAFDVRGFHTEVLKDGAVPLDVLDAKIERWIAARKAG